MENKTAARPFHSSERDWPGGDYLCTCATCERTYIGPKRSACCRLCASRREPMNQDHQAAPSGHRGEQMQQDSANSAPRVDELMELARQYAHAYYNHYTGTASVQHLERFRQRLEIALLSSVHQALSTSSVPDGVHSGQVGVNAPFAAGSALQPCPFCGGEPSTIERPDNIDGTEFVYAIACYCGGYSACAHKIARRKAPALAKSDAIAAWNRRSASSTDTPPHPL